MAVASTTIASAVVDAIPNLNGAINAADPDLRGRSYNAFSLSLNVDRNAGLVTVTALTSSAFAEADDRDDLLVARTGRAGDHSDLAQHATATVDTPMLDGDKAPQPDARYDEWTIRQMVNRAAEMLSHDDDPFEDLLADVYSGTRIPKLVMSLVGSATGDRPAR